MASPLELPLGPLMVDLGGETPTAREMDFLRHPALGAVILFARNYRDKAQVRALVDDVRAVRSPALLVAVDQEGGRVQRFKEGFREIPAAGRIGALYDRDPAGGVAAARAAGWLMAAEVLETGVDFSFAPVLDRRHPRSRVIGERALHRDPAVICELAGAWVTGMNRAGMAATGKHFPGHGGVGADSHLRRPVDTRTLAELEARDLAPFARLAGRLGGVMTAHVLFPNIHRQLPTYSSFWLGEILRAKLGFGGVIFSDDLVMKGADGEGDLAARGAAALDAGCDVALICNDPDGARRAADALGERYPRHQARLLSMRADAAEPDPAAVAEMAAALAAVRD